MRRSTLDFCLGGQRSPERQSRSKGNRSVPMSSELGTNTTDKTRFWPRLEPCVKQRSSKPFMLFHSRSAAIGVSMPRLNRCRVNSAHIRQSRPDSGLDLSHFLGKGLRTFELFPPRSAAGGVSTPRSQVSFRAKREQLESFEGL